MKMKMHLTSCETYNFQPLNSLSISFIRGVNYVVVKIFFGSFLIVSYGKPLSLLWSMYQVIFLFCFVKTED